VLYDIDDELLQDILESLRNEANRQKAYFNDKGYNHFMNQAKELIIQKAIKEKIEPVSARPKKKSNYVPKNYPNPLKVELPESFKSQNFDLIDKIKNAKNEPEIIIEDEGQTKIVKLSKYAETKANQHNEFIYNAF